MGYRRSLPLRSWTTGRLDAVATIAQAHASIAAVTGPGRPLEIGRPVGHAYVLRLVAEFQGFVRDLHDLGAERMVDLAAPAPHTVALLVTATTEGRAIDRGNADLRSIQVDFRRLGIPDMNARIGRLNPRWSQAAPRSDQAHYQDLIELRNALAHGNQRQVDALRRRGVQDTITWARARRAGLTRTARALDRVLWDHLQATFGADPW